MCAASPASSAEHVVRRAARAHARNPPQSPLATRSLRRWALFECDSRMRPDGRSRVPGDPTHGIRPGVLHTDGDVRAARARGPPFAAGDTPESIPPDHHCRHIAKLAAHNMSTGTKPSMSSLSNATTAGRIRLARVGSRVVSRLISRIWAFDQWFASQWRLWH